MLSVTGEVVVAPKYEYLDLFSAEGLARFEDHGLWGFVNEQGQEVISAQFEDANNFSEGLAAVKVDGLYGFIDVTGKMVIEPQFEGVEGEFKYGCCVISENGKQGIIDKFGMIIVKPQYLEVNLYCTNYFIVQFEDQSYGIIDRAGNVVTDSCYTKIFAVTDSGYFFVFQKNSSNKMYDFNGNMHYVSPPYSYDRSQKICDDSLIKVSPDGEKWGLFDLAKENYIIEAVYDDIEYQPGNMYALTYINHAQYSVSAVNIVTGQDIISGKKYVKEEYGYFIYADENYHMGVVNASGQEILPAIYKQVCASPQGEFCVMKGNKNYVINSEGKTVKEFNNFFVCEYIDSINCWTFQYSGLDPVEDLRISGLLDGSFSTMIDHEYFYFSVNGKGLPISQAYPNPIDISTMPVVVCEDNSLGEYRFINSSGYAEGWYTNISWFPDQGVLVVEDIDGKCGIVSYDGTVLFRLQQCHIFTNPDNNESINKTNWNIKYQYDSYNDSNYFIYTVKAGTAG